VKEIRVISQHHLDAFSSLTCDSNKIHKGGKKSFVNGALLNSIIAGIMGSQLPGHGAIVTSQRFSFPAKCYIDIPIEFSVELVEVRKIIKARYQCVQNDIVVFEGDAKLIMNKGTELE
jgi:acyl dehydratase